MNKSFKYILSLLLLVSITNTSFAQVGGFSLETETTVEKTTPYGTIKTLISSIRHRNAIKQELNKTEIQLETEKNMEFQSLTRKAEIKKIIEEKNNILEEKNKQIEEKKSILIENKSEFEEQSNILDERNAENEIIDEETNQEEIKSKIENLIQIAPDYDTLEKAHSDLAEEIATQEEEIKVLRDTVYNLEKEIENHKKEIPQLEKIYEERKSQQTENIDEYNSQIVKLREEIVKKNALIENQYNQALGDVLVLFLIILSIFVLRYVSQIIINNFSTNLSNKRKTSLLKINKIVFNIVLGFILLGVVFSQIATILPFIAILSTGVAFAIRDSISSFIGWFVIGTDRGYKVGHVIKVDNLIGKVKEIGPILTRLQNMSRYEKTGTYISIPNKYIFEKEIENLSLNSNFIQQEIKFIIQPISNPLEAKKLLSSIFKKELKNIAPQIQKNTKKMERSFGITEKELETVVSFINTKQGIQVWGRYFVPLEEVNSIHDKITHEFLSQAKESGIEIKFFDY